MLHPSDRGFCAPLSPPSGPTHPGAHPRVPSVPVPREKASRVHCDATARGAAVLLHADDQESLERSRYSLPEEDPTPTQHLEPGRSGPPHRLLPDSVSSHGIDDALWHGSTARRVGSPANFRYRPPTDGDPHPRRERASGPRCHAQSHAAGSLAGLLAWAEAQTHGMVIPGRVAAHLPSSHHSPSRVVCVPTGRPAGGPAEPGSSPHAAPLFRYPLAGKRS